MLVDATLTVEGAINGQLTFVDARLTVGGPSMDSYVG
jgi:hypothetical protein